MYRVNEIFRSVQGEGPAAGSLAAFLRFAGCNESCPFCDTHHDAYRELEVCEVLSAIDALRPSRGPWFPVVATGGEPLLQLDDVMVEALGAARYEVHVETNAMQSTEREMPGGMFLLKRCDTVVASPKGEAWSRGIIANATALKVVYPLPPRVTPSALVDMAEHVGVARSEYDSLAAPNLFLQPVTPFGYDPTSAASLCAFRQNCRGAMDLAIELARSHDLLWRVVPQSHVWMGLQ